MRLTAIVGGAVLFHRSWGLCLSWSASARLAGNVVYSSGIDHVEDGLQSGINGAVGRNQELAGISE